MSHHGACSNHDCPCWTVIPKPCLNFERDIKDRCAFADGIAQTTAPGS